MYIGFGHRLRGLGGLHVGLRLRGSGGLFFVLLYGTMNICIRLFWYMMLATFWMVYGLGFLFFCLPVKGFLCLRKKKQTGKGSTWIDKADQ